jgi:dienelactone hydrolase
MTALRLALAGVVLATHSLLAQGNTLEETIPPGANFDKAEFRLWYPSNAGRLQAIVVLVPGSNGDGRGMVADSVWQRFAVRHKAALVACRFTDKPHEQGFIEEYVDVSRGSGQALLDVIASFAKRSGHAELASAPLLMWGMSAGGQFNYEFVAWKPERVAAFVVNKGGIYYSALVPREARQVPGLLFVGEKDLAFRTNTIVGLFAVNRRAGALWALTAEPGVAHAVGRSRDLGAMFFEDVMSLRVTSSGLQAAPDKSGFLGNLEEQAVYPIGDAPVPTKPTAWLPTARIARLWQAVVTNRPFDEVDTKGGAR